MKERHLIIPFFIPHAGCPKACAFCNQWEISGQTKIAAPREIKGLTQAYLSNCKEGAEIIEVAFYGGSFTGLPPEKQESYLQAAAELKSGGVITGIRLSTRPDYIDQSTARRLDYYGVTTVELGVQSLVDEVLTASLRGHTAAQTLQATRVLREYPFKLVYQLMPGLPKDNRHTAEITARKSVEYRPDYVRIYPTVVLKGTKLEQWYREGSYTPWALEEAIEIGARWLGLFTLYEIPVIRLGLQSADNLDPKCDLVAGPYHPAYGELVHSRLFFHQLEALLAKNKNIATSLTVTCHPRDLSQVTGQKRQNILRLKEKYGLGQVAVKTEKGLGRGDLALETGSDRYILPRQEFLEVYRIEEGSRE